MLVYGSYIHTSGKSGGELLTLFDSYSYDGLSAGIWVIHTGKLVKVKGFFWMLAVSDLLYLLKRTLLLLKVMLWSYMPVYFYKFDYT